MQKKLCGIFEPAVAKHSAQPNQIAQQAAHEVGTNPTFFLRAGATASQDIGFVVVLGNKLHFDFGLGVGLGGAALFAAYARIRVASARFWGTGAPESQGQRNLEGDLPTGIRGNRQAAVAAPAPDGYQSRLDLTTRLCFGP
jgi:hypothetical protein